MHARIARAATLMTAALVAAACASTVGDQPVTQSTAALAAAFATVPVGYTSSQTTYDASAEGDGPLFPGGPHFGLGHEMGEGLGHGFGPMIGGGLGVDFLGGLGLGRHMGHGRHGEDDLNEHDCTFSSATGRADCDDDEEHGLTVTRTVAWFDADGNAQTAFDSATTDKINVKVTVSGTRTRHDSSTSVIDASSDRTVSGLAPGSTQHKVDGTAQGSEVTTGADSGGAFTATRAAADTIAGIIVPVSDTGRTYPIAGTITRVMSVSVVRTSGTTSASRREVITYDGSATATMVITQDGTTRTCSLPLPFGRPTCTTP